LHLTIIFSNSQASQVVQLLPRPGTPGGKGARPAQSGNPVFALARRLRQRVLPGKDINEINMDLPSLIIFF